MNAYLLPYLRRPIMEPPDRNPLPFKPRPPLRKDGYLGSFDIVGTAHFTKRSIEDAVMSGGSGKYAGVAIELDPERYGRLGASWYYGHRELAQGEFVTATDAVGNSDTDIWLIDWNMRQIDQRIRLTLNRREIADWEYVSGRLYPYEMAGIRSWEMGRKKEAMEYLDVSTRAMERYFPSLHRVLIEERNLVMASRLMEIGERTDGKVLVLVGAAHVNGIKELLASPRSVRTGMGYYGLKYTPPVLVHRTRVN